MTRGIREMSDEEVTAVFTVSRPFQISMLLIPRGEGIGTPSSETILNLSMGLIPGVYTRRLFKEENVLQKENYYLLI